LLTMLPSVLAFGGPPQPRAAVAPGTASMIR
jgi:hypothetical protein